MNRHIYPVPEVGTTQGFGNIPFHMHTPGPEERRKASQAAIGFLWRHLHKRFNSRQELMKLNQQQVPQPRGPWGGQGTKTTSLPAAAPPAAPRTHNPVTPNLPHRCQRAGSGFKSEFLSSGAVTQLLQISLRTQSLFKVAELLVSVVTQCLWKTRDLVHHSWSLKLQKQSCAHSSAAPALKPARLKIKSF